MQIYKPKPGDGIMYSANDVCLYFFFREKVTTDSLKISRQETEIARISLQVMLHQTPADFCEFNGIDSFCIRRRWRVNLRP
jgi:hypothetical protein